MTATMGGGPVGWVIERKGNDSEVEEILKDFNGKNKDVLDPLVDRLYAVATAGDGDSMMLFWKILTGFAKDLEGILTFDKAVVVPDKPQNGRA